MSLGQIERTGRKRRRKRLIIALTTLGALGLMAAVIYALSQDDLGATRSAASLPASDPIPQGPVTLDEADRALARAEAMQTLVSDLGTAVVEAGITDMGPLESLMGQAVDVASAAEEMLNAVDLGAEDSALSARQRFTSGVRDSEVSVEAVLQQLRGAGVDVAALKRAASE